MPSRDITRLLSRHRGVAAAPRTARLASDGASPPNGKPVDEQVAETSDQTTSTAAVEGRYLKSISRWTPERGGEVLACEQIDLDEAILHILEFNGVTAEAFCAMSRDQARAVFDDMMKSVRASPLIGQRPAHVSLQ